MAKLRETLGKYQDSRTAQRENLAEMMRVMDLDRLPALQRRWKHLSVRGRLKERLL